MDSTKRLDKPIYSFSIKESCGSISKTVIMTVRDRTSYGEDIHLIQTVTSLKETDTDEMLSMARVKLTKDLKATKEHLEKYGKPSAKTEPLFDYIMDEVESRFIEKIHERLINLEGGE